MLPVHDRLKFIQLRHVTVHGISESESELRSELDLSHRQEAATQEPDKPSSQDWHFSGLKVDNQVPSLHSQEPPKCWSLPLVTLTSIASALPDIPKHKVKWLLQSVDEGLFYVNLIEKSLDKKGNLVNSRHAADAIWVGVELYRKWQDNDLHETSLKGGNSKETLQELSKQAEKTIVDFKREVKDFLMENPLNWPVKVIAANSMYRICQRLLMAYEGDRLPTDEEHTYCKYNGSLSYQSNACYDHEVPPQRHKR
ncbi:UNVERIFIED_CONTAM: hypothetical protein Sradi_4061100 [Sesamum radiatum]|uniref:Uncharacterized protein n=1 Tax=Sesamum radiatum TaxID=300843 RepID=A0AAW2PM33_SESRA